MNIFFIDRDTKQAARSHCDQHVVKMILETAQLLATAHHVIDASVLDEFEGTMYRPTHVNHPSAVWTRESTAHYQWLASLGLQLCHEYSYRYGKNSSDGKHSCERLIQWLSTHVPSADETRWLRDPPQCMPDEYKDVDTIVAYRRYYQHDKMSFARYRYRSPPNWLHTND